MIKEDTKAGLGPITCIEVDQDITKILEAGQDMVPIMEVVMDIICRVIKDKGDIIIITEEVIIEIKVSIGIGVGHLRDRLEMGETVEARVILGQGQVLELVQR